MNIVSANIKRRWGTIGYRFSSAIETDDNDRKFFFPVAFGDKLEGADEVLTE